MIFQFDFFVYFSSENSVFINFKFQFFFHTSDDWIFLLLRHNLSFEPMRFDIFLIVFCMNNLTFSELLFLVSFWTVPDDFNKFSQFVITNNFIIYGFTGEQFPTFF